MARGRPARPASLLAPLADRVAHDVWHRVLDQITPSQSRSYPSAAELPRLFGPDGRYELVELVSQDRAVVSAAAATLGHAHRLDPGGDLAEAIQAGAEATATLNPLCRGGDRGELIETFARTRMSACPAGP